MRWQLYYDDKSVFPDSAGASHDSPPWGAVGVIQPEARGRTATSIVGKNGDFLLYRSDLEVWHLVGASGLVDHLAHFAHLIECVRTTRWMPLDSEFAEVWERMRADAAEAGFESV